MHESRVEVVEDEHDVAAVLLLGVVADRVVECDGGVGGRAPGVVGEVEDPHTFSVAEFKGWIDIMG